MPDEGLLVSPTAEIFKKANKIASIGADGKLIKDQIPDDISGTNAYTNFIKIGTTDPAPDAEISEPINNGLLLITNNPTSIDGSQIVISPRDSASSGSGINLSCPKNEYNAQTNIQLQANHIDLLTYDYPATTTATAADSKVFIQANNISLRGTVDNNKLDSDSYSDSDYANVPGAKGWYVVGYYQDLEADPSGKTYKLWLNNKQVSYENMSTSENGPTSSADYINMSGKTFASNCLVFYNNSHFINKLIYLSPSTSGYILVKCIDTDYATGNYALPPRQASIDGAPFRYGLYFSGANATETPKDSGIYNVTPASSIEEYNAALNYGEVDLSFTAFTSGYMNANGGFGTLTVGRNNASLGQFSTIIGRENYSEGYCSLIVGQNSICKGQKSLIVGHTNVANKNYNTLLGNHLTSNIEGEVVIGKYNAISTDENSAFVIGAGTAGTQKDPDANRANAIQILNDGTILLPAYNATGNTRIGKTYVKLRACRGSDIAGSSDSNVYTLKSIGSSTTVIG